MSLSLKQIFYILIILLAVTFSFSKCSRDFIGYWHKDKFAPGENLAFQQAQENRIRENLADLLSKLFGHDGFYISVISPINAVVEEEQNVRLDPQIVKETFTQKYTMDQPQAARQVMRTLPGWVPRLQRNPNISQNLPGFPLLPTASALATPSSNTIKQEAQDEYVVFNQRSTKKTVPSNKIERLFISVVIDTERFRQSGIRPYDLKDLIRNTVGSTPGRGDAIYITYMNIANRFVNWYSMGKNIRGAQMIVSKYQWYFIALLALILAGAATWGGFKVAGKIAQNREKAQEKENERLKQMAQEKSQEQASEFSEKRRAVVDLSKSKPGDVAQIISDWIEKE